MQRTEAQKILIHYFKVLMEKAGLPWTEFHESEIEDVVTEIQEDATSELEARVKRIEEAIERFGNSV